MNSTTPLSSSSIGPDPLGGRRLAADQTERLARALGPLPAPDPTDPGPAGPVPDHPSPSDHLGPIEPSPGFEPWFAAAAAAYSVALLGVQARRRRVELARARHRSRALLRAERRLLRALRLHFERSEALAALIRGLTGNQRIDYPEWAVGHISAASGWAVVEHDGVLYSLDHLGCTVIAKPARLLVRLG